jgi:OmpA-OmpF porin, OOP family
MRLIILLLLHLPGSSLFPQNLVPNPGFEEHDTCPNLERLHGLRHWIMPTPGTSDYYNECSPKYFRLPDTYWGHQPPSEGKGCVAIYCSGWYHTYRNYREYIQARLIEPLKKGQKYRVAFYVSLADICKWSVDCIGAYFSEVPIRSASTRCFGYFSPLNMMITGQIPDTRRYVPQVYHKGGYLKDKDNWMLVSGEFIAKGGEQYITIGNFFDSYERPPSKTGAGSRSGAYYFIDDVEVSPVFDTVSEPPVEPVKPYQEGQTFVLNNIYFDTDKYELLPASYKTLDSLADVLNKYSALEIEVRGHTDNVASEQHNLRLSANRAKAVKEYLVSKGIDKGRLVSNGYGEAQPIATNETKEGRQLNRRVEFKVLKI